MHVQWNIQPRERRTSCHYDNMGGPWGPMPSEISQTDKYLWLDLYDKSKTANIIETKSRFVVSRGSVLWGLEGKEDISQRLKISVIGLIRSGDLMYSIVIIANNTVVYIWKFLRE